MRPVVVVFGCFHPPGHRLYDPSKTVQPGERSWLEVQLDGMPDPAIRRAIGEPEGHVYRATNTAQVEAAGWSMVHWWDRQGDHRGGSHTCLAARGVWTVEELIAAGRVQVPWAFRVEVKL